MTQSVEDLLVAYCFAVDDGDWAAVADLFTKSGELDPDGTQMVRGRDALSRFFKERLEAYDASSHHLANVRIRRVEEAICHAESYIYARIWRTGHPSPGELWGRYYDVAVFDETGTWRLESRKIRAAGWQGYPDGVTFMRYRQHPG